MATPVEADRRKRFRNKVLKRCRVAGCDHIILGPLRGEHAVHRLDILRGPAPVAGDREISKADGLPLARGDLAGSRHDLLSDKPFRPQGALVVEEDAVAAWSP